MSSFLLLVISTVCYNRCSLGGIYASVFHDIGIFVKVPKFPSRNHSGIPFFDLQDGWKIVARHTTTLPYMPRDLERKIATVSIIALSTV